MEDEGPLPCSYNWTLNCGRRIQFTTSNSISSRSTSILFFYLHLLSPKWLLSFRFYNKYLVPIFHLLRVCYMSRPSYSPWSDRPNNICQTVHTTKLLLMKCSPLLCYFPSLWSTYSRHTVFAQSVFFHILWKSVHSYEHSYSLMDINGAQALLADAPNLVIHHCTCFLRLCPLAQANNDWPAVLFTGAGLQSGRNVPDTEISTLKA
jgi:hypothetical protein